jgi:hypothetical protein
VRLVRWEGSFGVEPLVDLDALESSAAEGRSIVLRFKPARDSSAREIDMKYTRPGSPVFRPRTKIRGAQICVQAGVQLDGGVLFEPWDCLPTRDAIDVGDEESDSE